MLSGKKLKMLRLHKNIKQQEIAKYMEVSKNYISMLENEVQPIPEERYEQWIKALNGGVQKMLEAESAKVEQEIEETEKEVKKTTTKKKK